MIDDSNFTEEQIRELDEKARLTCEFEITASGGEDG